MFRTTWLQEAQQVVALRGADAFTKTALNNGSMMGLSIQQMIESVCAMKRQYFYKSMTTHASSKIWQDVYHAPTPEGVAYVKITLREDGAVVIQFKEI